VIPDAPRVAFFADCFHEVNGVALTCRRLEDFARGRGLPFFAVHPGPSSQIAGGGSQTTLEYRRSPLAFPIDVDMRFDPLFLRHRAWVLQALAEFRPDIVHITGPGDCGILGAILAHRLRVPLVASWHTNLHLFAAQRLERTLGFLPARSRAGAAHLAERGTLLATLRFYRVARMLLAPNPELVALLERATNKPVLPMRRGVDTETFSPAHRERTGGEFVIGYVGRLQPEKSVRRLVPLEQSLLQLGERDFRFLIVGHGGERPWLEEHMQRAEFTGALQGEALARAYANMDAFVFPSVADTFGNVVQEALASGVPTLVSSEGGPKFLVRHDVNGFIARDEAGFVAGVRELMHHPGRRATMGRSAREAALEASWDKVFEDVYSAYGALLRRSRAESQSGMGNPAPVGVVS
jgi:glycosyltransferase involved in cell wall biosynthesis